MSRKFMKSEIKTIKAREILDSKGVPTIEVELEAGSGKVVASVPSGVSKGRDEALELRDGGVRYQGMGVLKAVRNVNEIIAPKLKGKDATMQKKIDELLIGLDNTDNKSNLGANAILPVSIAVLRAGAAAQDIPLWEWISRLAGTKTSLPLPCILFIEGGLHGKGNLDAQEIMILFEAGSFRERLRIGTEIYHNLGKALEKKYGKMAGSTGLEGGFSPNIEETEEALQFIMKVIKKSNYKGEKGIILDIAANSFYQNGKYFFEGDVLSGTELMDVYSGLCSKYPIVGIEDPFNEEDWGSFKEFTGAMADKITIIGDDLLVTNMKRIERAKKEKACNGVIVKPNQIGTVTETIEAAKEAAKNKWKVFVKHRSGETKDDFIADLATGLGNGFIMAGAPNRGERVAKYNRLLKIEEELKIKKHAQADIS